MTFIDFILANPLGAALGVLVAVSIAAILYAAIAADSEGRSR
ncbi:hypothetical protein ACIRPH_31465 [Nocardiopsis sp. NPDC101807]